jgi:L-lactate dehydrogenase
MISAGETSIETLYQHTAIIHSVINSMRPFRPDTILLVVSTPVDILTSLAQELSGLPKCQVFGSGTFLDSARLRRLVAHKLRVRARVLLKPISARLIRVVGCNSFRERVRPR